MHGSDPSVFRKSRLFAFLLLGWIALFIPFRAGLCALPFSPALFQPVLLVSGALLFLWSFTQGLAFLDKGGWPSLPRTLPSPSFLGLTALAFFIQRFLLAAYLSFFPPDLSGLDTEKPIPLFLVVLSGVLVGPIFEEFVFRYVLWRQLAPHGPLAALLASTALFAALHSSYAFATALIFGILSGLLLFTTNDLRLCMLLHIVSNSGLFFFRDPGSGQFIAPLTMLVSGVLFAVLLPALLFYHKTRSSLKEAFCAAVRRFAAEEALLHPRRSPARFGLSACLFLGIGALFAAMFLLF